MIFKTLIVGMTTKLCIEHALQIVEVRRNQIKWPFVLKL